MTALAIARPISCTVRVLVLFASVLTLALLAPRASRAAPIPNQPTCQVPPLARAFAAHTATWRGSGEDARWNNPANWAEYRVPSSNDRVHLTGAQSIVFDGTNPLAGLVLDANFSGRLYLARPLIIAGDLVIENGALAQSVQPIHVAALTQNGGEIIGGSAPFVVDEAAQVRAGMWTTPAGWQPASQPRHRICVLSPHTKF